MSLRHRRHRHHLSQPADAATAVLTCVAALGDLSFASGAPVPAGATGATDQLQRADAQRRISARVTASTARRPDTVTVSRPKEVRRCPGPMSRPAAQKVGQDSTVVRAAAAPRLGP